MRHASHKFTFYYEYRSRPILRPLMVTFEQFVKGLGKEAGRYTESELGKLYVDVQQLAEIVLAAQDRKQKPPHKAALSTEPEVDGTVPDRTVKRGNEHAG